MLPSQWLGVWLLVASITTLVDYHKGRSGWMGLILGIVFGPVGLILVLTSSVNGPELELRAIKGGHLKKCPKCAKPVYTEAKTCQFCGYDLGSGGERIEQERT